MPRVDGRAADELRPCRITRNYIKHAEGSCLIEMGDTRVVCTATVEERVPLWRKGQGAGWVTAEYGMIPRSCKERNQREASRGGPGGRTFEIQRLVGRALRSVVDLEAMGERTIWLDCDVIQADGGTRTASITGSFIAVADAFQALRKKGVIKQLPLLDYLAAISVGKIDGKPMLDLAYSEDSAADVDMNVVMTGQGRFVEVQGTAERYSFDKKDFDEFLALGWQGIQTLVQMQKDLIGDLG